MGRASVPSAPIVWVAVALALASCEADVFLGYGLPGNDACRQAASLPGKPITIECLDSLGR